MLLDAPSYESGSDSTSKKEKEIEQKLTPETAKAIMRNANLGGNTDV